MFKKIYTTVKSSAELIELVGKILAFLLILFGTTISAFWARTSEELSKIGPFIWVIIAMSTAILLTLMIYFINLSFKIRAQANLIAVEANHIAALSTPKTNINPLAEVFVEQIIYIPDLFLPVKQEHRNKVFKRCKFVGPGAIAILGGTIINNQFLDCGDFITLADNTEITGIVVLNGCTIENCEIVRVTITSTSNLIEFLTKDIRKPKSINLNWKQ